MVRTAASLERLDTSIKMQIGAVLLKNLKTDPDQTHAWLWALGRVGSRQPIYGPLNGVIPSASVAPWVNELIALKPDTNRTRDALKLALMIMARKDPDRSLDLDEALRIKARTALEELGLGENLTAALMEYQPLGREATDQALGESLPIGLSQNPSENA